MEKLIQQVFQIREDCRNYGDKIAKKYGSNNLREGSFSHIYNKATFTAEILSFYHSIWKQSYKVDSQRVEAITQENAERCMEVTKWLYIGAVSSIEFHIRGIISTQKEHDLAEHVNRREKMVELFDITYQELDVVNQEKLRLFRKTLKDLPPFDSFSRILNASEKLGLLSARDAEIWKFAVEMRNCTVHNNAIGSRDTALQLGDQIIEIKVGKMTRAKLDIYTKLTSAIVHSTFDWVQKL